MITFRTFLELFEGTKLLKFENLAKELNFSSPSALLLTDQKQNILKSKHLGVNEFPRPPGCTTVHLLFVLFHVMITNQKTIV